MARVPVPAAGAGTNLRPVTGAKFEAQDQTAGLRTVGNALQQTGEFVTQYADEQDRIDATLDRAAVRQADVLASQRIRERLWTGDNAFYKQQGFNAANARPQVEKDMEALRDQLRGGLTTDRQRAWFDQAWTQRAGQEAEGISRYVTGQVQVEERKQSLARITEASNDAITYWNDPVRRDTAIATAIAETRSQAATAGWAPEVAAEAERSARSNIYTRAIGGMIDRGEIENAQAELIRNRDLIAPDEEVKLDAALRGPLLDRQAEGIVDDLMGTAAPIETVTASAQAPGQVLPRMVQITAMAESGNRDRDASGRVVTSPKGAQGRMQVMPGTNLDPGFGVRPAANNSDEERARVGRDYLAAMMKRYGNDPAKAWAAYNWGPGNLDAAIKKYGGNWLQNAPAETRAYVSGNMSALGGRGANAPVQQRPAEHDMTTLLARVDQMNLPFDVEQKVRQRLTQRVALDEGLLSRQREQAQEQAWGTVEALGDKFTSVNQIPADVRARMTPQQRLQFQAVAERNVNQGRETDWQAYVRFSDMAGSDPRAFAALNPAEMRAKLSNQDFEQFMGMRRSIQSALAQNRRAPEQVSLSRVKDVTDPLLAAAGITRPPEPAGSKKRDPAEDQAYWARIGQFQRKMTEDVAAWQDRHPGQQIDDNTIRDLADRQLLRVWERDVRGNKNDRGFAFENTMGRGLGYSAPTAEIERIKTAYRRRWGRNPTEAEVDQIYRFGPRGGR